MAKIRFLDQVPIGVFETNQNGGGGGITSGSFTGSFSGSFTGSLQGTASWSENALTSSYSNNINGESYYIPTFINDNTLVTSSIYQSGSYTSIRNSNYPNDPSNPDILYVDGDGTSTYNLISTRGNLDSYVQINIQNINSGSGASSDIVATADDGDESTGYIDMGINSSQYTASNFVGSAKDAYLYSTGNDLYIGNASAGQEVIIFNGGLDALNNAKIHIHDQGTVGINTNQYNVNNPPSLVIAAPNTSTNTLIKGEGAVDSFLQLAISNANAGTQASTDIVAYNDLDPSNESFGFIDMGINSSNFDDPINFPGWTGGDSYLYTDSPLLRIGSTATGSINFFLGSNPTSGSKFELKANNNHLLSGSLDVSGSIKAFSFTGSLQGTASNAQTASYLNTLNQDLTFNGNLALNGTASIAYLNVTYESASVIYSSGSNQFGDATDDTQTLIGRTIVSGSFEVTGSTNIPSLTGSLLGTASFANNALSSSFTTTSSFSVSSSFAVSSSYALSASFAPSTPPFPFTGSALITGSLGVTGSVSILGGLTGSALLAQNLTGSEIFRLQNDRDVVIGGGSASTNTQVTINPFRVAGTTNHVFRVNAQGTDNYMRFVNSDSNTDGGLQISRDAATITRRAFSVGGAGGTSLLITANGSIGFNASTAGAINTAEILSNGIVNSSDAGKSGLFFTISGTNRGFTFYHPGLGSNNTGQAVVQITKDFTNAEAGNLSEKLLEINGTFNLTNGTKNLIGINYNPTITALSGAHYGLLIRPLGTLNGIGHTTNLPTATWHVKGNSDTVGNALQIDSLTGNRLIIGNNGEHAINTTVDTNFNLKIVGDKDFIYQSVAGDRYFRFKPLADQTEPPVDIRTSNTNGNSLIMFVRGSDNGVRFKLSTAAGAGTYLTLGSNVSTSPFGYFDPGLRVYFSTHLQGNNNEINENTNNKFSAIGLIASGDFGTDNAIKQSIVSIQSRHTNTSIVKPVSMLRMHQLMSFNLTGGTTNGIIRAIDVDYTINQTGGATRFIGIDYQPTITSILGDHYGLLIRPSTLNGIGLGSTLPSASLHIRGGLTGSVLQLESNTSSSIFTITNAGSGSYTGSFSVLGGITGSLFGTASFANNALSSSFASTASIATSSSFALSSSYALTASFALNGGGGAAFPFTGSAVITGSLIVTGSVSLGDPTSPAVYTSIKTTVNSGSTVIYNVLTSSYDSAFFDYSLKGSSGARAGNIMAIWSGSNVSYTDNSITDIGNTSDFIFGVILSGSNMVLTGSTSTNGWDLKTAIRTI